MERRKRERERRRGERKEILKNITTKKEPINSGGPLKL